MGDPAAGELREHLDTPGQDPRAIGALLADIRRANARYGGRALVLRWLAGILPSLPRRPLTLLDVAAGGCDIPLAVDAWARARGVAMRVIALDRSAEVLAAARRSVEGAVSGAGAAERAVALVRADALALPFPDRAVDLVTCGLALHHAGPDAGLALLREIDRVAREAFLVHDLVRSPLAYAAVWVETRLPGRSRLARCDGPLSVRRAFTPRELRRMADAAGLADAVITRHPLFRMALSRRPAAGAHTASGRRPATGSRPATEAPARGEP